MYYMGAEEFARTILANEYENFINYINKLEESQYKDYALNNYEISYDTQIRIQNI